MQTKKLAGVSINLDALPGKEDLIKSALQSSDYFGIPEKEALKDINQKIKESELYRELPKPVKKPD